MQLEECKKDLTLENQGLHEEIKTLASDKEFILENVKSYEEKCLGFDSEKEAFRKKSEDDDKEKVLHRFYHIYIGYYALSDNFFYS